MYNYETFRIFMRLFVSAIKTIVFTNRTKILKNISKLLTGLAF